MNKFVKFAVAATMTGAFALALATPSEAEDGRNTAAAIGFGAGVLTGAVVANSANNGYYDRGYAYDRGYSYNRGYAYQPSYAYEPVYSEPAPRYYAPSYDVGAVPAYPYEAAPRYYSRSRSAPCGTGSPGSVNYRPCNNN